MPVHPLPFKTMHREIVYVRQWTTYTNPHGEPAVAGVKYGYLRDSSTDLDMMTWANISELQRHLSTL